MVFGLEPCWLIGSSLKEEAKLDFKLMRFATVIYSAGSKWLFSIYSPYIFYIEISSLKSIYDPGYTLLCKSHRTLIFVISVLNFHYIYWEKNLCNKTFLLSWQNNLLYQSNFGCLNKIFCQNNNKSFVGQQKNVVA